MERSVRVGDTSTHYIDIGAGTPIVILHGWGSSASTWQASMEHLSRQGFRCIAVDLPGFGQTQEPPEAWNLADYTSFVREFLAEMGVGRFVLLGHSFGGRIAIDYTSRYGEEVAALILSAAAGIVRGDGLRRRVFGFLAIAGRGAGLLLPSALRNTLRKAFYIAIRRRDYERASSRMREVMRNVVAEELLERLDDITQPTLLLWGDEDGATPISHARAAKERLADATLVVLEGRGHSLQREVPEEVAARVGHFLKEHNIKP